MVSAAVGTRVTMCVICQLSLLLLMWWPLTLDPPTSVSQWPGLQTWTPMPGSDMPLSGHLRLCPEETLLGPGGCAISEEWPCCFPGCCMSLCSRQRCSRVSFSILAAVSNTSGGEVLLCNLYCPYTWRWILLHITTVYLFFFEKYPYGFLAHWTRWCIYALSIKLLVYFRE